MLKFIFLAASIIAFPSFGIAGSPIALGGPGGTQIYADPNCSVRPVTGTEGPAPARKMWIDCEIDAKKVTLLIQAIPKRAVGRDWFKIAQRKEILGDILEETEWRGYEERFTFQGGSSGQLGPAMHWHTRGVVCETKKPCHSDGPKLELVIIGWEQSTVALLAVGDGTFQEVRLKREGAEPYVTRIYDFPRSIRAMVASFNFQTRMLFNPEDYRLPD